MRVRNDQFVHKGDILLVIDQDRYRIALADAEAVLATRRAQHQMSLRQFERRTKLTAGFSITTEDLDNAHHNSDAAAGNLPAGNRRRDLAALNLRRTEVRASVNGT